MDCFCCGVMVDFFLFRLESGYGKSEIYRKSNASAAKMKKGIATG